VSSPTPLVQVEGLAKYFDHEGRRIDVLRGVDLTIHRGDKLAVVGRSGAGKSTLLHLLGTLDKPSEGTLRFDGKDVLTMSAKAVAAFRNSSIGFMFQFHHLLPEFTALENVMMPALIRRQSKADARGEAAGLLEAVGLADRMRHRPGELSGGEQQRVALARAVMGRPRLLLADEPTGNLDSRTSDDIHTLFDKINEEHGTAMLVVTHNADLAQRMPRQLHMVDGRLTEEAA
jgi:lipoprotein-releasing system ATP-binding protein